MLSPFLSLVLLPVQFLSFSSCFLFPLILVFSIIASSLISSLVLYPCLPISWFISSILISSPLFSSILFSSSLSLSLIPYSILVSYPLLYHCLLSSTLSLSPILSSIQPFPSIFVSLLLLSCLVLSSCLISLLSPCNLPSPLLFCPLSLSPPFSPPFFLSSLLSCVCLWTFRQCHGKEKCFSSNARTDQL